MIRTTGSWYNVLLADCTVVECRLRGNFRIRGSKQTNPIAVGDRVAFQPLDDGTGMITDIEDRRNYIVRRSTKLSKQTHVIAANIDLLCLVATLGLPRTSTGFIDRLLVTAEAYHIPAVIIFNKCDLYDDDLWQMHNEIKAIYTSAGYPVYEVSALNGTGIDAVKELIAGKTCLFSGHSGVGKSALLNAIDPSLHLRVGEISDWSLKGKHTTTFAEIFPIKLDNKEITSEESQNPSFSAFRFPHRHPRHQGVRHCRLPALGAVAFLPRDALATAGLPLRQLHPSPRTRLCRQGGRRKWRDKC